MSIDVRFVFGVLAFAACGPACGQPADVHFERVEAIAWESAGGRDGRENRWGELEALFADLEAHRDAADEEVAGLLNPDDPDPWDAVFIGFMFQMVGGIDYHEKDFADGEQDYLGRETPEERRALFRDAEAVYIRMLDGMDDAGLIGRLRDLQRSEAAFVPVADEPTAMEYHKASQDQLSALRKLTQMLDRRMLVSAQRGDWDRFLDDLGSMLWLAEVSTAPRVVTAHLFGIAGQSMALRRVRVAVLSQPVPEGTLGAVAALLAEARPIRFEDLLDAERIMLSVLLKEMHDEQGRLRRDQIEQLFGAHDLFAQDGEEAPSIDDFDPDGFPTLAETEERADELWAAFVRDVDAPSSERWRSAADAELLTAGRGPTEKLPAIVIPALLRAERGHLQLELQTEGVRTLVAIERHRRDHGGLPDRLADLVPEYLHAVPLDPLNNDQPLVYRLDGSELGYVLYTVGFDGVDDGGMPAERVYDAFAPDAKGVDFFFTQP